MKHATAVNLGSRLPRVCGLAFTTLVILGTLLPTSAQADRVIVTPLTGSMTEERRAQIETLIASTLQSFSHEPVAPAALTGSLETSDGLRPIAESGNAKWVVVPHAEPLIGQYRLVVRVYYVDLGRVEELVANVVDADEAQRLNEILAAMLRPEGLGDDALRLSGGAIDEEEQARLDEEARLREAEAALRAAEEERARLEEEERLRQEQEAAEAAEEWESRPRYGESGGILLQAAFSPSAILASGDRNARGGFVGTLGFRIGYPIEAAPGLEIRGGLDAVFASTSGISFYGGLAYLASPFRAAPVFLGGVLDLGIHGVLSGNKGAAFLAHVGPALAWSPSDHFTLEIVPVELTILSRNGGSYALGGSLRAGYRL